jgi:serine protease Do
MNFWKKLAFGSVMVLAITAVVFGYRALWIQRISESPKILGKSPEAVPKNPEPIPPSSESFQNPFIPNFEALAAQVKPSLVNINTERLDEAGAQDPFEYFYYGNDAFNDLFRGYGSRWISLGSGFIVNPDGYILTNSHVIENAYTINVKLVDRRVVKASVVGTDPQTDLAVLKIQSSNLPALYFTKSDTVAVGDWVAAFGRPSSLVETISAGIISARGPVSGSKFYDDFLQTDAAVNPENRGGPLVNLQGKVVGVNTAIAGGTRGFDGVGFAIPSDTVQRIYNRLVQSGNATRGWMGVHLQDMTPALAISFGLNRPGGALVSETAPDGPAAKAGIQSGDVILEYDGRPILNRYELSSAAAESNPGKTIPIKILRNGKELVIRMTVGERPSDVAHHFAVPRMREPGKLGITVENITPEIQSVMHLSSSDGVLVIDVIAGSAADNGGVKPGDIIHAINQISVHAASDLLAVMRSLNEDSTVLLRMERKDKTFYLAFRLS